MGNCSSTEFQVFMCQQRGWIKLRSDSVLFQQVVDQADAMVEREMNGTGIWVYSIHLLK